MGLIPIAALCLAGLSAVASGVAIYLATRTTPQRLLTSLRRAVRESELVADRVEAIEQRFDTHRVAVQEHLEAVDGLADRMTRERKRLDQRAKHAEGAQPAEPGSADYLADLRTKARGLGMPV